MTIFHVLKYPPKEIIDEWLASSWSASPKGFVDLLPEPVALRLLHSRAYKEMHTLNMASYLAYLLLEYEGPL
jgi:hypothetical protein